jgi:hypothetical protein
VPSNLPVVALKALISLSDVGEITNQQVVAE